MTRYFFHTASDQPYFDPDGTELDTLDVARAEACRRFAAMLDNQATCLMQRGHLSMVVEHQDGRKVMQISCFATCVQMDEKRHPHPVL